MKVGIKLWSTNSDLYEKFIELYKKGSADYLEIKYILGRKEKLNLLRNNNIPVIIHAPNYIDGACFSDGDLKKNKAIFKELADVAEYLNAGGIIIHPEIGTERNFIEFLKNVDNSKIIIENMPQKTICGMAIGFDHKTLKKFLDAGKCRFCLDFCHAIKSAVLQNLDYRKYIEKLLELKPEMFHICDGHSDSIEDEHLNLGEGDFDLEFLKNKIKNKRVTLEVPKKEGLYNDLKNIQFLRNIKTSK